MDILLKPELKKFIDDLVRSGSYNSTADAIGAAVARLQPDHELLELSREQLRCEIDAGLAEADRGEFVEFTAEDVIAERRAALASRKRNR